MSHITHPHWIELMGALIGALGIMIAIYLQLITQKDCPPRYVILFLSFGITMTMVHSGPFISSNDEIVFLQITGYILLAVIELVTAYYVWRRLDLDNPVQELWHELFGDSKS